MKLIRLINCNLLFRQLLVAVPVVVIARLALFTKNLFEVKDVNDPTIGLIIPAPNSDVSGFLARLSD